MCDTQVTPKSHLQLFTLPPLFGSWSTSWKSFSKASKALDLGATKIAWTPGIRRGLGICLKAPNDSHHRDLRSISLRALSSAASLKVPPPHTHTHTTAVNGLTCCYDA